MKVEAVGYLFKDATYTNYAGKVVSIPNGIWQVAELDMVSVMVGGLMYDMPKSVFDGMKAAGMASRR